MRIFRITLIGLFFFITGFSIQIINSWFRNFFGYNYFSKKIYESQIIETSCLDDVKNHIQENTLVIFDLDNTLIAPTLSVGSDAWFSYMVDQKCQEGYSSAQAIDAILPLFRQVHKRLSYSLVESTIPHLLADLKSRNIPAIILTNRGEEQKKVLLNKLTKAGLPLPFTQFRQDEITAIFDVPMLYSNGIIFCGRNDKGAMLFYILDTVKFKPSKVIFIDDKYHYLASVERACVKRKIPFVGIRYGKCDELVSAFNPKQAEEELKTLFDQKELSRIALIS